MTFTDNHIQLWTETWHWLIHHITFGQSSNSHTPSTPTQIHNNKTPTTQSEDTYNSMWRYHTEVIAKEDQHNIKLVPVLFYYIITTQYDASILWVSTTSLIILLGEKCKIISDIGLLLDRVRNLCLYSLEAFTNIIQQCSYRRNK